MKEKKALREEARRRRAALSAGRSGFSAEISRFAAEIANTGVGAVAGYVPLDDEADPRMLMDALARAGRLLALPCVVARGMPLRFRRWKFGDKLTPGALGILEPVADLPTVIPDVVLVPLLAFDSKGHRLGYGGGYYDRTLDQLRRGGDLVAIGVAFAGQEVEELPRASHDHMLDMIVTERGVRKF